MKKILLVCVLLFSVSLMQAQSKSIVFNKDNGDVKTEIAKADLPIGKPFTLLIVGSDLPIFAGLVDEKLITKLPTQTNFVLSVNGQVNKFRLEDK